MSTPPNDPGSEPLLEHSDYLRRLSRGLLYDPGRADDAVQRAWLEAVRAGRVDAPRSWLSAVVRNVARQTRRDEARRREHERAAARPEAMPSSHESLERLETLERVVAAAKALDEPYRSTLLRLGPCRSTRLGKERTGTLRVIVCPIVHMSFLTYPILGYCLEIRSGRA